MPDWDNTESRERDEDAAWRDLVARFDAPQTAQQPVPWPAREDMPPEPDCADGARESDGKHRGPELDGVDEEHGRHAADGEPGRHAVDEEPGRHAADDGRGLAGSNGKHGSDGLREEPDGIAGPIGRHGRLGADGASDPEVIQVPRRIRGPVPRDVPADGTPAEDEEHFVPPARRRCPSWTRWPRAPGRPCSAGRAT